MKKEQEGALSGYRVLDITDSNGAYCTKLLADLGADVIKIEPPEGDPGRRIPPFAGDTPHPEKSLHFLHRNANKRGVTLRLDTMEGSNILKRLVTTADVLVDNSPPDYMEKLGLDYSVLSEINPGLIMASITEFGHSGPYKDRKGSNLVDFAMSGIMITSGYPGKEPCLLPGSPAYDSASVHASVSIVAAIYMRGTTGQGQYIDTSVHVTSRTGLYPWIIPNYSYALNPGGPPPTSENRMGAQIYPVYPCKDGFIRIIALTPRQWDALVRVLDNPDVLQIEEWRSFMYRIGNADDLYALMLEFTTKYTMRELFEAGRREGVPIAPILNIADFYNSPQTKAREYFVEVDHPVAGKADYPSPPYKWTETPATMRRPAPCIGEHNEEVYCRELGLSTDNLASLRGGGIV
ncbi:MAG: CoA transferase [Dehalococcoidia bacterium]|nr:CoA transferase [Dehalococcoidia bacterium]